MTLMACVAVAALQAGGAAAQSADDTLAWLRMVAKSDDVTIGSVRPGLSGLELQDVTLRGNSQVVTIANLTFPDGFDSTTFAATGLRTEDVFGEIGGASADVLTGDILLINGIIENSLFVFPCTTTGRESQLHAENVSFWSDLDMAGSTRGTDEMSRVASIDAQVLLGEQCSEINVADVDGIATRGIGGATGYIANATWVSNPGLDTVIQASVSDFRAISAEGVEFLSVAAADIGIAPSVAVADIFTSGTIVSALLRELSQGSFSFIMKGVTADLSAMIPSAKDGGFDVPAGHRIDGDVSLKTQGGDLTQIDAVVDMAGIGDFALNAAMVFDPALAQSRSPVEIAGMVKLAYANLSIADDGLNDLVKTASGADVPDHIAGALDSVATRVPQVPGNPIAPIFDNIADWTRQAFASGGSVAIAPDAPVSLMEMGLTSMGGPARLADTLGLETGPAR